MPGGECADASDRAETALGRCNEWRGVGSSTRRISLFSTAADEIPDGIEGDDAFKEESEISDSCLVRVSSVTMSVLVDGVTCPYLDSLGLNTPATELLFPIAALPVDSGEDNAATIASVLCADISLGRLVAPVDEDGALDTDNRCSRERSAGAEDGRPASYRLNEVATGLKSDTRRGLNTLPSIGHDATVDGTASTRASFDRSEGADDGYEILCPGACSRSDTRRGRPSTPDVGTEPEDAASAVFVTDG